jgi:hypothetical protein
MKAKSKNKWLTFFTKWWMAIMDSIKAMIALIKSTLKRIWKWIVRLKDLLSLITAIATVIVAVMSVKFTTQKSNEALARMELDTRISNKPIVILSQDFRKDSSQIVLWNTGPGTAYNITIEMHLAGSKGGSFGNPFILDVIQAIHEIETKDQHQLAYFLQSGSKIRAFINPPPVLAYGVENGYHSTYYKRSILHAIYTRIKYFDVIGNKYYSVWDGTNWIFGEEGDGQNTELYNKEQNRVKAFKTITDRQLMSPNSIFPDNGKWKERISELPFEAWLTKESYFLYKNGYGDVPEEFDFFLNQVIERDNEKKIK